MDIPRSVDTIIEHIAKFTEHTERETFNTSLISTLFDFLQQDTIRLHHIVQDREVKIRLWCQIMETGAPQVYGDHEPEGVQHTLSEMPVFMQCYKEQTPITNSDTGATLYPLFSSQDEVTSIIEFVGSPLQEKDIRLIESILKVYRNHLRVLNDSMHDTLTGLLNRRTFEKNLNKILAAEDRILKGASSENKQERREHNSTHLNWLAVFDIDHFKHINDRYGHLYGDEVLLLFSNIMKNSFRSYDRLFRFGGEEFVVVLKSVPASKPREILERFRNKIAEYVFPQVGHVTVSIGYVQIHPNNMPQELVGKADSALYYAKENGRNKTCSYEELVEIGEVGQPLTKDDIEIFNP